MPFTDKTIAEYLRAFDTEDFTNCIRTSALVISFLLLAFRDRKVWFTADLLAAVGFGAAFLICPAKLLQFQLEGKVDNSLLSLSRMFGASVLTSSVIWWRTRETRDGTVYITLMQSRVVSCSVMLVTIFHCHFFMPTKKPYWNEQHLYFSMVGTFLWLLGNLLQLLWSYDFNCYPQHNIPLNAHLRIDALLTLISAVSLLMFPEVGVIFTDTKLRASGVHLHVVRGIAVMIFGSGIISLQGPGFLHERDKKSQLVSRMLGIAVLGLTLCFNHYWYGVYRITEMMWLTGGATVVFLNAFIGCVFDKPLNYEKYTKVS